MSGVTTSSTGFRGLAGPLRSAPSRRKPRVPLPSGRPAAVPAGRPHRRCQRLHAGVQVSARATACSSTQPFGRRRAARRTDRGCAGRGSDRHGLALEPRPRPAPPGATTVLDHGAARSASSSPTTAVRRTRRGPRRRPAQRSGTAADFASIIEAGPPCPNRAALHVFAVGPLPPRRSRPTLRRRGNDGDDRPHLRARRHRHAAASPRTATLGVQDRRPD